MITSASRFLSGEPDSIAQASLLYLLLVLYTSVLCKLRECTVLD